ncbi:DMT family transporter [Antrihabitans sp. YC2-6]|uniref:EamA family transporter n=1 Tax=Antrihabitans sp. YC2-6 TaxID=2799498 RepID=UPI0018F5C56C|nr:EamA family transporter [Antrihabitans sp. YC2-6]MBJ8347479.1 EamA family transporter [Antrihabitans sp. YC2-6]
MRATAAAFATSGVTLALLSAMTFGLSGPFIKSLLDSGWSPGGTVLVRISAAAVAMVFLAVLAERRRPTFTRHTLRAVVLYGIIAVALVQAAFVFALQTVSVGVTLMIQFLAPILVIAWEWLVHGRRPSTRTVVGSGFALVGAALVVDPFSGVHVSAGGLGWAFLSTLGLAGFFVISRSQQGGVSNLVFGAAGMTVGAVAVGTVGAFGLMPIELTTGSVTLGGAQLSWWAPLIALVAASTVLPYLAGIAAVARVGPTLSSLVLLNEVLFGTAFAWILLDQAISPTQVCGGLCIVSGVALAHLGGAGKSVSGSASHAPQRTEPHPAAVAQSDTAHAPRA